MNILIYGYGNPGRQDDGLGVAFADAFAVMNNSFPGHNLEIETAYQLNIEDAEVISSMDIVIFADASMEPISDFVFTRVQPDENKIEFTMHAVSVSYILGLCNKLYHKNPETYLLHIKGYEWELQEGITDQAQLNLKKAIEFMKSEFINLIRGK